MQSIARENVQNKTPIKLIFLDLVTRNKNLKIKIDIIVKATMLIKNPSDKMYLFGKKEHKKFNKIK